jgi:NAD(P)-dependent dehydrogenase (short-subunit alcohol dehydrogenase family)
LADELSGVALVTGGGRGIGANIARELASAGMKVAISARSRDEVDAVAEEIGGSAIVADMAEPESIVSMVEEVERELGPIDLLVANAGISGVRGATWEADPEAWWQTHLVNVRGVFLCCRAVIPGMLKRGGGRIVVTSSGAAYLPGGSGTAYSSSKAGVNRFAETLAGELRELGIPVFPFSPGLVRTAMTEQWLGDDAPWTPPELAPQLVRVLASGRADRLSGRYIHAEHDDIEDLIRRADEIAENDLNAIRLQR